MLKKMRIPKLPVRILKRVSPLCIEEGCSGDIEEEYEERLRLEGRSKADRWIHSHALKSIPKALRSWLFTGGSMFSNYMKTALRHIKKDKGYSFINLFGLAIGIACCLLAYLYMTEEKSYDNYHGAKERIFRIAVHFKTKTFGDNWAAVGPGVGPIVKADFPQVMHAGRIFQIEEPLVKKEQTMYHEENVFYADQDILDIFTIPFLQGDPEGALDRPNTLILSERMADKYFGDETALGNTLIIDDDEYEVTGVVKNHPSNTHFKYGILVSFLSYERATEYFPNWGWTVFHTYIKLAPGVDREAFAPLLRDFEKKHVSEEDAQNRGYTTSYFMQPIADIHLHSHIRDEIETPGNPLYVSMTGIISLFILLIACVNFMNLSTARFSNRAKEVGLRKVLGARRKQLIVQFLGESFVMTFLAFCIAFVLSMAALPLFNDLSGKAFTHPDLFQGRLLLVSVLLLFFVGILSGCYPAICLSTFMPGMILRTGRDVVSGSSFLRKILVVGQFAISIALLAGTFVVYTQLRFMKARDLGFDAEQKLNLPWSLDSSLPENYQSVKDEFTRLPGVMGATVSSAIPGYGIYGWQLEIVGEMDSKLQYFSVCMIDDDFIPEFDIQMAAGRPFVQELSTDIEGPLVINETAVRSLGA